MAFGTAKAISTTEGYYTLPKKGIIIVITNRIVISMCLRMYCKVKEIGVARVVAGFTSHSGIKGSTSHSGIKGSI